MTPNFSLYDLTLICFSLFFLHGSDMIPQNIKDCEYSKYSAIPF